MLSRSELLNMTRPELQNVLAAGHPVSPEDLVGAPFEGVSLGLPRFVERLTWKRFSKAFVRDEETGRVRGYNIRLEQAPLDEPTQPMMRAGEPIIFGHFGVEPSERGATSSTEGGLQLDYSQAGAEGRFWFGPLRDPLVAVNPGDPSLLLGRTDLVLLGRRFRTPSYFYLTRARR